MKNHSSLPVPKADPSWKIGIVAASFYPEETEALIQSAIDALKDAGLPEENISVHMCTGSFEIPLLGKALAEKGIDALIGIGIIVQGETKHADLLATETARGIMDVQLQYGIPFAFEVLHVPSLSIAQKRLDKGKEAAIAVLHSVQELKSISG